MSRVLAFLLLLATSVPARAELVSTAAPTPPTPWYLPRGVFLGTFIFNGAVTPELRVQWEWTLVQEPRDSFVAILEGGGGYAIARPSIALASQDQAQMTFFYQHMVTLGLAYRGEWANGLHVGAQAITGPFWYGARYDNLPTEGRLTGVVEGRFQIGKRLGPVVLGVSAGLGTPYAKPLRTFSVDYLAGFVGGVFLDWRIVPPK